MFKSCYIYVCTQVHIYIYIHIHTFIHIYEYIQTQFQIRFPNVHLENSVVATGLEKVSFHSNPKEMQCQRMFKLPHNCKLVK